MWHELCVISNRVRGDGHLATQCIGLLRLSFLASRLAAFFGLLSNQLETNVKIITALISASFVLVLSAFPARADVITATIPGADFSVSATIGTFVYDLPPSSTIDQANIYSPHFSFPAAPGAFILEFGFDGTPALSLPLSPMDTGFFIGNDITFLESLLRDGPMDLSVRCFGGPCPETYTKVSGGLDDWRLVISFTTAGGSVPEPPTLVLLLGGLVGIVTARRFRVLAKSGQCDQSSPLSSIRFMGCTV
jgi:hypothetical protein